MKLEELKKEISAASLKFEKPPIDAEPMACWWIFGCTQKCANGCSTACSDGCAVRCPSSSAIK